MSPAVTPAAHGVAELQRRTLRVLVASQALGGLGISVGIAVAVTRLLLQVLLSFPE